MFLVWNGFETKSSGFPDWKSLSVNADLSVIDCGLQG